MSDKKLSWLPDLIQFGGTLIGIVLTAIGGVLLANAVLKLYVFQLETRPYDMVSTEECRYDYTKPISGEIEPIRYERTAEEIEVCKQERLQENRLRFEREKKSNMVDGLALLIVGIPFWLIFRKKRK